MKARRFFAFVAGAAMLFGVGCTPEGGADEDTTTPAEIAVSPAETAISLEGDTKTFSVTSNASWVATCDVEGVTVSPELGKGNASVTVVVPATTAARSVVVTFNASKPASMDGFSYNSTATATATIFQNAGGEVVEGGIASIKAAGDYDIEGAWVVAASSQSFVMTDNSGGCILTYLGNGATIPAVGTVLNVSGAVTTYGGLLQFGKDATITPTGETVNVAYGSPMDISTYSALDAYAKNLSVVYAEMKGQLVVKDSGKGYNNYNLVIEGHDDYNDYKGSISYAPTALANQLNGLNGAYIIARGYMVGISGTVYANMVTLSVEVDSSHPVLQAENITNVPVDGVENATHNITIAALDNVTATPDGVIVTAASVSGNVLTYTVAANDGPSREGKITLSAAGVADVVVSVFQKGVQTGDVDVVDDVLNLAFTGVSGTNYTDWSGKVGESGAVYAGQSAGDKSSIQLRSKNNNSGIVTTTTGGKARKVVVTWHADTAAGRTLDIYGSNEAYTSPTELYGDNQKGTKLGSIVKGTSTELEIIGDYAFIAMRSKESAMYLTDITISWEK